MAVAVWGFRGLGVLPHGFGVGGCGGGRIWGRSIRSLFASPDCPMGQGLVLCHILRRFH